MHHVMIVDDDASIRDAVEQWLTLNGFGVQTFSSAQACLAALPPRFNGAVLSDVRMPGMDGLSLLERLQHQDPDLPVILLTGHGDVPMAVEAMRAGACDFLEKPFSPQALLDCLTRALNTRQQLLEHCHPAVDPEPAHPLQTRLLGGSTTMQTLRRQLLELAAVPVNVLIRGETGSGKEQVARCLHDFGPRAAKPFVALNCAAIPEQLFEAELFGHEQGAFTGAQGQRMGKLEYANGGTLFLDEIESMPLAQQAKLLRVLQEQKLERLGSNRSIALDLRIVAATKPDLLDEARAGRFREDLAYRLTVAQLRLAPLRLRREDIAQLFEHFVQLSAKRLGKDAPRISSAQLARLLSHDWPGNVRELANVAERHALGLGDSLPGNEQDCTAPAENLPLAAQQQAFESSCLRAALHRHRGDIRGVLEELQLPRRTLNEKMNRHGLLREDFLDPL
jgi:two-component system C4-dicarboxylate transport response regulator DctD